MMPSDSNVPAFARMLVFGVSADSRNSPYATCRGGGRDDDHRPAVHPAVEGARRRGRRSGGIFGGADLGIAHQTLDLQNQVTRHRVTCIQQVEQLKRLFPDPPRSQLFLRRAACVCWLLILAPRSAWYGAATVILCLRLVPATLAFSSRRVAMLATPLIGAALGLGVWLRVGFGGERNNAVLASP